MEQVSQQAAYRLYEVLRRLAWQDSFDDQSLVRGLVYSHEGRVGEHLEAEQDDTLLMLHGEVAGRGRQPYGTHVAIYPDRANLGVIADCSCPVASQCKHAVALIDAFLNRMKALGAPAQGGDSAQDPALSELEKTWSRWLAWCEAPGSSAQETVDDRHRLGLFLDITPDIGLPALKVQAVWLRPSRQASRKQKASRAWVRPQTIALHDTGELSPAPADGWPVALEERLTLLLQGEPRDAYLPSLQRGWTSLVHPYQVRALWELLEAAEPPLLYYRKQTGTALAMGPGCRAAPAWQADDGGVQRLHAALLPEGTCSSEAKIVKAGRGLCYLDPEHGLLGPLEGNLRLLQRLRSAPEVTPEMSDWLAERLQGSPLADQLPPPVVVEETTLAGVTPGLCVHMEVVDVRAHAWYGRIRSVGAGVVTFDYDGVSVAPEEGEQARVFHRGQQVTVSRDAEAERALVRSLPSGMVSLERLVELEAAPDLELPPWTLLLPLDGAPPETAAQWFTHLAAPEAWWPMIHRLRQAGCRVTFAADFPEEPRRLTPDAWHGELAPAGNGWFELGLDIEVEGERLDLLPILQQLLQDPDFPLEVPDDEPDDATYTLALDDQRELVLPLARLRGLMTPILDWLGDAEAGALRLPVTAAQGLEPLATRERWQGREGMTDLVHRLKALPARLPAPKGFTGQLRDYQAHGLAWLRFLSELPSGGILADDMGLGKTIQVLAHVLDERQRGALTSPTLVVAPTSLVGNWCAEAARFAPGLRVLALQGGKAERQRQMAERLAEADLVVTTYPLLIRDVERLSEQAFGLLVLDEAQAVKNAASQTAQAVRALEAHRTLAMTGTPLENHLGELWAQLDAVAPGVLGSQQWFGQHFRTPIEKEGDVAVRQRLSRRIAPLMLRRTKQEVLTELPEKIENRREITLPGAQRELYETLRLAQHQRVQQAIAERGLAASGIVMLDALLKLRQVCCDPRLVKLDSAQRVRRSAKLDQLRELLPPLIEEGRRILVFSQFTEMLGLIGKALVRDGIPYATLTGDTPGKVRTERVAAFQQGEVPVFLISLRAGGVGLNLTAADTVIHYDPWWNPAVEAQATGRAHRLGQRNPVFVYKLVCAGTVEERIVDLQARKADLATSILEGSAERGTDGPLFDEEDLALLFAPVGAAS
nr:DEAD/DEAH box helicase [Halomonas flagellata]